MAYFISPQKWVQKPAGPITLNYDNPLTRGIIWASTFQNRMVDFPLRGDATYRGPIHTSTGGVGFGRNGRGLVVAGGSFAIAKIFATDGTTVNSVQIPAGSWSSFTLIDKISTVSGGGVWRCNHDMASGNTFVVLHNDATYGGLWIRNNSTDNLFETGGTVPANGTTAAVSASVVGSGGPVLGYINGNKRHDTTSTVATEAMTGTNGIHGFGQQGGSYTDGIYQLQVFWNRGLSRSEHIQMYKNPWQIFSPLVPRRYFGAAAAATFNPAWAYNATRMIGAGHVS